MSICIYIHIYICIYTSVHMKAPSMVQLFLLLYMICNHILCIQSYIYEGTIHSVTLSIAVYIIIYIHAVVRICI